TARPARVRGAPSRGGSRSKTRVRSKGRAPDLPCGVWAHTEGHPMKYDEHSMTCGAPSMKSPAGSAKCPEPSMSCGGASTKLGQALVSCPEASTKLGDAWVSSEPWSMS